MTAKPSPDLPKRREPVAIDNAMTQSMSEADEAEGTPAPIYLQMRPGGQPVPGYELVEKLGAGGFGEVWKAKGPGGFSVALKFLRLEASSGSAEVRALEVMKDIRHANLLSQFGCWEIGGHLIIAMELGDRTLFDRLQDAQVQGHAGIPGPELLDYLRDAARGLDHLHDLGIQHRDIKPQNFLIVGGSLKVADFGLAKLIDKNRASNSGSMTPAYAAPEFFRGRTNVHSDQYSLAVSYCQLRGGKLPFDGSTTEIMYGHLENQPDLTMLPELERPVLARALAKKPEERWPTCRGFVQALANSMATPDHTEHLPLHGVVISPAHAPETAPPPRARAATLSPPPKRVPRLALVLSASALIIAAGSLAWTFRSALQEAPNKERLPAAETSKPGTVAKVEEAAPTAPANSAPVKTGPATVEPAKQEKRVAKSTPFAKSAPPRTEEKKAAARTPPPPPPVKPAPVAMLKLAPLEPVSLKPGASARLTVKVDRENVPGAIAISLEGLPAGVKAGPITIEPGAGSGQVEMSAAEKVEVKTTDVQLVARAGDVRASRKFRLQVLAPPVALAKEISNGIGMKLVLITPGKFQMGSPKDELGRKKDEGPRHEVTLSKPFYLGKYEVTRQQFQTFVTDADYETEAEKDGQGAQGYNQRQKAFEGPSTKYNWKKPGFAQTDEDPVVDVSWNDAVAFCTWLSKREGKKYKLPTEAEWEYACRAGTTEAYPDDDPDAMVTIANLADGTAAGKFGNSLPTIKATDGYVFTAPVGKFKPNAWGLYDMHGNVWEWCRDWWSADTYQNAPAKDPAGPDEGESRVIRGGSWSNLPSNCRAANRGKYQPDYRHPTIGFRVALYPD